MYGVSTVLVSPHAWVRALTVAEHAWNMAMGEVCISVEHAFGIVLCEWPFLCSSWKHQMFGMACGLWYCAVVLLSVAATRLGATRLWKSRLRLDLKPRNPSSRSRAGRLGAQVVLEWRLGAPLGAHLSGRLSTTSVLAVKLWQSH